MEKGRPFSIKTPTILFCLSFLLFSTNLFAAVPINDKTMQGEAAAEARIKIIAAAESYLGTPYRYAGSDRRGMDCSGLVYTSFREGINFTIPRSTEGLYAWAEKIERSALQPGDLVFFATYGSGVSHVGIFAGEDWFIHSASEGSNTGVIYSQLSQTYWRQAFIGAGRALPWDSVVAEAYIRKATDSLAGVPADNNSVFLSWSDNGFFTGFGAAWSWGGFIEGSSSVFRGISAMASVGYKWPNFRAGLGLRPVWDHALGVFRLPITVSIGNNFFQIFGGPAYTFGKPSLSLTDGERHYSGGGSWLWEAGLSAAFFPVTINRGALGFYGELAWQPYFFEDGEKFHFKQDVIANLRLSTGMRYFWLLK